MAEKKAPRGSASIKWKIFLYLLGFCFLLLVILWLFQTVFLEKFYTSIKLGQVEKAAAELATLIEKGDMEGFEENIHTRGDLYVELSDPEGHSTTFDGFYPEFGMGLWSPQERQDLYQLTQETGGSLTLRYAAEEPPGGDQYAKPPLQHDGEGFKKGRWGAESILHAKIVHTPEGEETLMLVRAAITPVNATVATLQVQLWYISAILLALSVGLALLISRRVARPIEKLNHAAAELGSGHYDVTFEGKGYREVAELAGTLNHTAGELAKTDELRRDLIANVSHDLRTPLTLITGYAEMMRDIPGENNPENMQIIIDEAKRLSSLVGDLLDLSQLQSGTAPLHLEELNLTGEVEDILARFSKFSQAEGASLRFENTLEAAPVEGDPARIAQVLYNFLINAMTHGGEDKIITVRQKPDEGGRVRVEVTDTGEGIPADQLPYIWDRYYKVDKVHKRGATGSGLGLSIVKGILQQHPGMQYGVQSTPGQGSTFWFSLPLRPAAE